MSGERRKPQNTAGERRFQPAAETEEGLYKAQRPEKNQNIGRRAERKTQGAAEDFFKTRARAISLMKAFETLHHPKLPEMEKCKKNSRRAEK